MAMKKLLSLPPNLVECFYDLENAGRDEWFCTSDPIGHKLGSGGGTTWLLDACYQDEAREDASFADWLSREKRILLHAGGQSRRLPAYAPSGKILTPIPVFRWKRGQRLTQNLLSLQLPLYEEIMKKAPASLHTLIASGDVYIRAEEPLQEIPEADVVCYGLWADPDLCKDHGVFVMRRDNVSQLDFMLQKPSVEEMGKLMDKYLFLMDIGIWILSDRAIELMRRHSLNAKGEIDNYDMYGEFGLTLGNHPVLKDAELNGLKTVILPLPGGRFYHYGTSREMISSTVDVQNLVTDQREIMLRKAKPHPAMFVQNAQVDLKLKPENADTWIENSHVGKGWNLASYNIITGVPQNNWNLTLREGMCVDVVPVGEKDFAVRPYGYNDKFKGKLSAPSTTYLGAPFSEWAAQRGIDLGSIAYSGAEDIQSARIFAICDNVEDMGKVMQFVIGEDLGEGKLLWEKADKYSADEISAYANLSRLAAQRKAFRKQNWTALAANYRQSVFYQLNLEEAAHAFAEENISLPEALPDSANRMERISDSMFRSRTCMLKGDEKQARGFEDKAFALMREGLTSTISHQQSPHLSVYADQIVWSRSPVRIDVAGGWTDTPPYSLMEGGNVVNLAIELNGQPPLQVYVKPSKEYRVTMRSIDLGAMEVISSYEELSQFNKVGSPFSIPKAALALAGFLPGYCAEHYESLEQQLKAFGSGIEITLLSAIPAGSGLGTSSILSSTVLGGLNDFCGLGWDKHEIADRTLILEQLLTTGGGWQDQYGGVLEGIKLLQTEAGWAQRPLTRWLPEQLFRQPEYTGCHLLYYTGITRTAKNILAEIVRGMFLNETERLDLLRQMKQHALDLAAAVQANDFEAYGRMVRKTWNQNQALDAGTNPPAVKQLTDMIDDLCLGYKLPGAGGGGYLYMVAKDPDAAARIRRVLNENRLNSLARFVDMRLSDKGLETSRS